ncbi:MAG: site-specific DNA-methyltransferase, partial [Pseudomonadota bacterium]
FVFKATAGPHLNTVALGKHGRNRSNVWPHRGLASFGEGRGEALGAHPTVKPVRLIGDALQDCTRRGDVVLDPFAGSGTLLIAAHRTKRRARLMEIDPLYCDVAIRRWQSFTGKVAIHSATGRRFDDLEAERPEITRAASNAEAQA